MAGFNIGFGLGPFGNVNVTTASNAWNKYGGYGGYGYGGYGHSPFSRGPVLPANPYNARSYYHPAYTSNPNGIWNYGRGGYGGGYGYPGGGYYGGSGWNLGVGMRNNAGGGAGINLDLGRIFSGIFGDGDEPSQSYNGGGYPPRGYRGAPPRGYNNGGGQPYNNGAPGYAPAGYYNSAAPGGDDERVSSRREENGGERDAAKQKAAADAVAMLDGWRAKLPQTAPQDPKDQLKLLAGVLGIDVNDPEASKRAIPDIMAKVGKAYEDTDEEGKKAIINAFGAFVDAANKATPEIVTNEYAARMKEALANYGKNPSSEASSKGFIKAIEEFLNAIMAMVDRVFGKAPETAAASAETPAPGTTPPAPGTPAAPETPAASAAAPAAGTPAAPQAPVTSPRTENPLAAPAAQPSAVPTPEQKAAMFMQALRNDAVAVMLQNLGYAIDLKAYQKATPEARAALLAPHITRFEQENPAAKGAYAGVADSKEYLTIAQMYDAKNGAGKANELRNQLWVPYQAQIMVAAQKLNANEYNAAATPQARDTLLQNAVRAFEQQLAGKPGIIADGQIGDGAELGIMLANLPAAPSTNAPAAPGK